MRSISSDLNEKIKSSHQTPSNNADPKMSIKVSRARTTIMDSDYWTIETIREKDGLGDISLTARRRIPYGPPDRIYEIHVDEGMVKTTIREYPDYLKDGWKPQFELGEGTSVAIAFDAHWEIYRKRWRVVTTEKPYIFWVDASGALWGQLWDETETKFQLATSVVKVKSIRGWKNFRYPQKDQGLVVAYIKTDGNVYYRNLCQQLDYSYLWESERLITGFSSTAQSVNLFITNDYRIGFAISDNTGNIKILITERNWSGMALEDHSVSAGIDDFVIGLTQVNHIDTYDEHIINAGLTELLTDLFLVTPVAWNSTYDPVLAYIELDFGTNLQSVAGHQLDFGVVDSESNPFVVSTTGYGENQNILRLTIDMAFGLNTAIGDITVVYQGTGVLANSGLPVEQFEATFTPEGLIMPQLDPAIPVTVY